MVCNKMKQFSLYIPSTQMSLLGEKKKKKGYFQIRSEESIFGTINEA